MSSITRPARLILRRVLMAVGVSGAALACAACYGVYYDEYNAAGKVLDKVTGKPIPAIQVTNKDTGNVTTTGEDGAFTLYAGSSSVVSELSFEDVDGEANGNYGDKALKNVDVTAQIDVELTPYTADE